MLACLVFAEQLIGRPFQDWSARTAPLEHAKTALTEGMAGYADVYI